MNTAFTAGFSRVDITPAESLPLAGYGNTLKRLSAGVLDPIFATCIALTDNGGETLLLFTVDLIASTDSFCIPAREAISKRFGIEGKSIIVSATHTHSAPDLLAESYLPILRYRDLLVEKLTEAASLALADRKPASMQAGVTYNEGMNFVRHYVLENGSYAGDNFGDFKASTIRDHVSDADRQIRLVRFQREGGKDLLLVNWQAHPTKASTSVTEHGRSGRFHVSSDFIGAFRDYVEEKTDLHVAYFQGACGNINSRSKIEAEDGDPDHVPYGRRLGDYVLAALDTLTPLSGGKAETAEAVCKSPINHSENHLLAQAKEIYELWQETNDPKLCTAKARAYGINSPYHAHHILEKAALEGEISFTLSAGHFGELAFGAFPYEMFDTNGKEVREASPFAITLIFENANGRNNYIPSARGFEHGCYEADSCKLMPGTGEKAAALAINLLKAFKRGI